MVGGVFFYIVMVLLFSQSAWLPLSFGILALAGLFNIYNLNLNQTFYQLHSPNEVRGRVLAVYGMSGQGLQPLGNLVMGPVIAAWGFSNAVASFTIVAAVAVVIVSVLIPEMWRLRSASAESQK